MKHNYIKIKRINILLLSITLPLIGCAVAYLLLNKTPSSISNIESIGVTAKILPFSADRNTNKMVYQVETIGGNNKTMKVQYWTDKKSPCSYGKHAPILSMTELNYPIIEPETRLVELPWDDIEEYAFFQFSDGQGNKSGIYAAPKYPIFQCGPLVQ